MRNPKGLLPSYSGSATNIGTETCAYNLQFSLFKMFAGLGAPRSKQSKRQLQQLLLDAKAKTEEKDEVITKKQRSSSDPKLDPLDTTTETTTTANSEHNLGNIGPTANDSALSLLTILPPPKYSPSIDVTSIRPNPVLTTFAETSTVSTAGSASKGTPHSHPSTAFTELSKEPSQSSTTVNTIFDASTSTDQYNAHETSLKSTIETASATSTSSFAHLIPASATIRNVNAADIIAQTPVDEVLAAKLTAVKNAPVIAARHWNPETGQEETILTTDKQQKRTHHIHSLAASATNAEAVAAFQRSQQTAYRTMARARYGW